MKKVFSFLLAWITAIVGCSSAPAPHGVARDELVPGMSISPAQAFTLASPHLDKAFERLVQERPEDMLSDHEPSDQIFVKGEWYYVKRDNYPWKFINLRGAVRVHGITCEVVTP